MASEAQLGRTQALFNGAFNLGVTGSAFAFGVVAEHYGYRTMFSLAALTPHRAPRPCSWSARTQNHREFTDSGSVNRRGSGTRSPRRLGSGTVVS